jgi:hypothetical protein
MISFRIIFLNIHSGLFFLRIQMKGLYAFLTCFMHATYAVHLIILIIFTQKYIKWEYHLWNTTHKGGKTGNKSDNKQTMQN